MNLYFKNILIPIDLTVNTEVAVKKALELAEEHTNIHLLYVRENRKAGFFSAAYELVPISSSADDEIEGKVMQWEKAILETYGKLNVSSSIVEGDSIQKVIIDNAKKIGADLIIIGKNSNHSWLPFLNTVIPSEVAKSSGSAVLTIKPGGIYNKVKIMVVPVTTENAMHKLDAIYAICRRSAVKIHLATFTNGEENKGKLCTKAFLQLYQALKGARFQVDYTVLKDINKAKAILKYAEKVNADIILVDTDSETKIGWPNKHISDIIPVKSKLQVWAV